MRAGVAAGAGHSKRMPRQGQLACREAGGYGHGASRIDDKTG